MSQGDRPGSLNSSSSKDIKSLPTSEEHHAGFQHHHHQILITKASSSPPRSRSQSTGSAHKEALLFFERNQLFQSKGDELLLSSFEEKVGGGSPRDKEEEEEAIRLIRKRSLRGRSHSQPSQVHLCAGGSGNVLDNSESGSGDIICKESSGKRKYTNSWLEQIQFTAQYDHYRTNDYASVVNSASSLDKDNKECEKNKFRSSEVLKKSLS